MAGTGTTGTGTAVRVFVDDAVQGRFPRVSAATGRASDGWLTVNSEVARSGRVSTPVLLLLLIVGPIGWAVLLALAVFGPDRGEQLTVEVPWSIDAQDRIVALRRRRRMAWAVATAGVVALFASIVVGAREVGGPAMTTQVIAVTIAVTAAAAIVVALTIEWRIGRDTIAVTLDASRRWVTLGNVHPAFARAVRAEQERLDEHHR